MKLQQRKAGTYNLTIPSNGRYLFDGLKKIGIQTDGLSLFVTKEPKLINRTLQKKNDNGLFFSLPHDIVELLEFENKDIQYILDDEKIVYYTD